MNSATAARLMQTLGPTARPRVLSSWDPSRRCWVHAIAAVPFIGSHCEPARRCLGADLAPATRIGSLLCRLERWREVAIERADGRRSRLVAREVIRIG